MYRSCSCSYDACFNGDPADRIIAGTSILKQALIVTADTNLRDAAIVEIAC